MATVRPNASYDPLQAANDLIKAMKGFGCNEKQVIQIVSSHTNVQRQEIKRRFFLVAGKDLDKELKSELKGDLQYAILALMDTVPDFLAKQLMKAMKGVGTDESLLVEIICGSSNKEIKEINEAYNRLAGKSLEDAVSSDTSGHLRRVLVYQCQGKRSELCFVDRPLAEKDARVLHEAGEARFGTDESVFNEILCSRNYAQLRATFDCYKKLTGSDIEEVIAQETRGPLKEALFAIVRFTKDRHGFFADRLRDILKGPGTKEEALVRVLVSRAEVDLGHIAKAYQDKYRVNLSDDVRSDTKGNFQQLLLNILNG